MNKNSEPFFEVNGDTICINTNLIEKLKKRYKGTGLSNEQMLQAANVKLTPRQAKQMVKVFKNTTITFEQIWNFTIGIFNLVNNGCQKSLKNMDIKPFLSNIYLRSGQDVRSVKLRHK